MYESRAIGRYLATQGSGPELMPTDPKARNVFEQAASIEYSQFDPIASFIIFEKIIKPRIGQTTNEAVMEALVSRLGVKLDGYEAVLSKQKYLAGDVRHAKVYKDGRCTDGALSLPGGYPRRSIQLAKLFRDLRRSETRRFREAPESPEVSKTYMYM